MLRTNSVDKHYVVVYDSSVYFTLTQIQSEQKCDTPGLVHQVLVLKLP